MKKKLFLSGILGVTLVFGLILAVGCNNIGEDDGGSEDTTRLTGTWEASGGRVVVFSGTTFTYKVNGFTKYSGTFSTSGSTITFNESILGAASGGFQLSGNTLTLSNHTWDSSVEGVYTKSSGSGNTTRLTGTWEASGGRVVVFSGTTFTYKVNGVTKYSGTFSTSGSTITFNESRLGAASGGFQLSGNTLTLSNHTWDSSVEGVYTKSGGEEESSSVLLAPSGVSASRLSSSVGLGILTTWDSVQGADGYIVYRASGSIRTYTAIGTTHSTSYTDRDVSGSTTYYYKIAATNGDKVSEQSQEVSATTGSSTATLIIKSNSAASRSITIRNGGPLENGSVFATTSISLYDSPKSWTVSPGKYTIVYASSSGVNYNDGITISAGQTYTFTLRQ